MKVIQSGQLKIFWRNHIFETFSDYPYTKRVVFKRKRDLMLAMPIDRAVTLQEMITAKPELTLAYSQLSNGTILRDIGELIKMGLLVESGKKYQANTRSLKESLPDKKQA